MLNYIKNAFEISGLAFDSIFAYTSDTSSLCNLIAHAMYLSQYINFL